jgi:chloramphenicol-sensitive protein RarD
VYFKAVREVPPLEVLAHRIVWSVPFVALLIALSRGWGALAVVVRSPRVLRMLAASAVLVAVNWLTFITAVGAGRILETSLGYYINPLVSVVLGVVFLGERLRRRETVAVVLAVVGTAILTVGLGQPPWVALILAFSFGFYGLLRKVAGVGALTGLLVETTLLLPVAVAYLVRRSTTGTSTFGADAPWISALLALGGVVTALPLIWFAAAARRLRYATVGIVQYLAPSLSFLLATVVYGEPFTAIHAWTFAFIWAAVALFVGGALFRRS